MESLPGDAKKGKHCQKTNCRNGVVDPFRPSVDGGHVAKKESFQF